MDEKDIRRWYQQHGVEFIASDWKRDPETGESLYPDGLDAERRDVTRLVDSTWMRFFEEGQLPWFLPRDRDTVEALEEFFSPYIAMLPRPKGNVLRQLVNDTLTYQEIAEDRDVSRQGAWKQVNAAVTELVRLVARDDPAFTPPRDGRRRDKRAELASAAAVLNRFWKEKFGDVYPGLDGVE